jgi:hypothetical protein
VGAGLEAVVLLQAEFRVMSHLAHGEGVLLLCNYFLQVIYP